jgi:type VI secretion system protein ImpA
MTPVDPAAPCGSDLEYDPEFVVLSARVVTQPDAQYGDFVGSPEPVNWSEIERDCKRLMIRSKDIRLAVLFCRCRSRLAGPVGLSEGLSVLAAWLKAFPEAIHPQLAVDADRDAALEIRMNALQSLTDTEGLLGDVREITLIRATATRLQIRDVERAFAQPRPGDALAPESVARQLDDLRVQQPTMIRCMTAALVSLSAIDSWGHAHLGIHAPDLSPLLRLLQTLATAHDRGESARIDNTYPTPNAIGEHHEIPESSVATPLTAESNPHRDSAPVSPVRSAPQFDNMPANRQAALALLCVTRQWFETHEPSSPIPVLLKRAEWLVGKRYAEVVTGVPAELLLQWDRE